MTNTILYIPRDDPSVIKYCIDSLTLTGAFEVVKKNSLNFTILEILSSAPCCHKIVAKIVGDVITTFYKFRVLKNLNSGYLNGSLAHYALIGALLSVDADDEQRQVYNKVKRLNEIAPESLLELRLPNFESSWNGLCSLTEVLLKQSSTKADFYELVSYFIASEKSAPKVTVTDSTPPAIDVGGVRCVVPELTGDVDTDLLLAIVRERPAHIVIQKKEALSHDLLEALRSLGENKN